MTDHSSRWLKTARLKNMAASTCDDSIISSWCSSSAHYGLWTGKHNSPLCHLGYYAINGLGISHSFTTAYQPQSNGMIEHAHCTHYCTMKEIITSSAWWDILAKTSSLGSSGAQSCFKGLSQSLFDRTSPILLTSHPSWPVPFDLRTSSYTVPGAASFLFIFASPHLYWSGSRALGDSNSGNVGKLRRPAASLGAALLGTLPRPFVVAVAARWGASL
jgi:hypothetical protein